jgi:hypothetical protein
VHRIRYFSEFLNCLPRDKREHESSKAGGTDPAKCRKKVIPDNYNFEEGGSDRINEDICIKVGRTHENRLTARLNGCGTVSSVRESKEYPSPLWPINSRAVRDIQKKMSIWSLRNLW